MSTASRFTALISLPALALASCAHAESGESAAEAGIEVSEMGEFEMPWAIEFIPGTPWIAITEKEGALKLMNSDGGQTVEVSSVPEVAFGGQGGFGDVLFLESESEVDGPRTIYLSWAEFGEDGETRGAVVGRGMLDCEAVQEPEMACSIEGLDVIWRQAPKVTGRGHYSHRLAFSPDEQYLFVASGDRQKLEPAQDNANTLGTIVRLNLDGTPAEGNPFADQSGVTAEIWSYGHRNILGMAWDEEGRLWDVEHGPAGGDELNLVAEGANYGWPTRSYGNHYRGEPIPDHTEDDGFTKPLIHWTPVIAPGDMLFYSGEMFADWRGDALIAGLSSRSLVRVEASPEGATEAGRYAMEGRVRSLDVAPDGAIWLATDEGKLLRLSM